MGLMAAAGHAPHDEILVESCTSRHRLQSGILWCLVFVLKYDDTRSCGQSASCTCAAEYGCQCPCS